MRQIDLLIAGTQRSATTSLLRYLGQHPAISTHQQQREFTYFNYDEEYKRGYETAVARYFPEHAEESILLAKGASIMYDECAIARVKEHNRNMYLVLSLRHPVDRAYSAYWYARRRGWEDSETFEATLDAGVERLQDNEMRLRECNYLERGQYVDYLQMLSTYFDRKQLHVFLFDEIQQEAIKVSQQIFRAVGVDDSFEPDVGHRYNAAAKARTEGIMRFISRHAWLKQGIRRVLPYQLTDRFTTFVFKANDCRFTPPPMLPQTRKRLLQYFAPYNEALSDFLGRDLPTWNE